MKQMLMHIQSDMLQAAVLQDGLLVDFFVERPRANGMVGSIYKGRVVNVLPGMDAAFVDIGLAKNAFLYRDDLLHPHIEKQPAHKPAIQELVKPGQELIVQMMKEPIGRKGARVTTHYALPGRYLVYMPYADYVGVSKKVSGDQERARLKTIAEALRQSEEGIIMRTAAEAEHEEALQYDVAELRELWSDIVKHSKEAAAPAVLHTEAQLMRRIFRDKLTADFNEIWVDDAAHFKEAEHILDRIAPKLRGCLKLYENRGSSPMFEEFRVSAQLDSALARTVPLKSGGYLIWEQTEALTVIDVNTGKYVGETDLEATVFHTNMEAAEEIARLLRIHDAGGIIIVDFIDMELEEHRDIIMGRLIDCTRLDHTKCSIVGWTRLGLFEITRKKSRNNYIG